jgi:hypothetical protein
MKDNDGYKLSMERMKATDGWIQTYTGKQFWPLDPDVEDIDIIDIAHSLSNQCRFTGHTRIFYSVAEHSVYVSMACKPENTKWSILHDASEAYISDMASPVKKSFPLFNKAEEKLMKLIAQKFGLEYPPPEDVTRADYKVLAAEKRDLFGRAPAAWTKLPEPWEGKIEGWSPVEAEKKFLARYYELFGEDE